MILSDNKSQAQGNGPYEIANVPGMGDLKVIVVSESTSQFFNNPNGSKSPWWMVSMKADNKEVLSSTVTAAPYKDYTELFGFYIESYVVFSSTIANKLFVSSIIHEDCIIVIPNAGYVADLEQKMHSGVLFGMITIVCLGWIKGTLQVYHRITFTNSFLVSIIPDLDRAFVRFRVVKKNHTFIPFSQAGVKAGQSMCLIDLTTDTTSAG
ncbi:MAG: hypothetical protein LBF84_03225 [Holosporales bacterium]|jgi:hypothetical protein|nr:hypothetical protein [Holosporales bacterium]